MAVSISVYSKFMLSLVAGDIDFNNDVFRGMLVGPGYVPNSNVHRVKSDVTNEITGSGYAAGGALLAISDPTINAKTLTVPASTISWPVVTFAAARYLVIYDDTPTAQSAKPLIACIDFGATRSASSQSFYYNFPNNVLMTLGAP